MLLNKVSYSISYCNTIQDSVVTAKNKKDSLIKKNPTRNFFNIDSLQDAIYINDVKLKQLKIDTTRSEKHISNIIVSKIFNANTSSSSTLDDKILKKIKKFNKFEGLKIDSVIINRGNVFSIDENNKTFLEHLEKGANSIHKVTSHNNVEKYLLFKVGDKIVPEDLIKSEAFLRDSRHISSAEINIVPQDGGGVNVYVDTRDTWSITGQLYYRLTDNAMLRISDNNFLGTGNRLDLNEYFNVTQKQYLKATEINYHIPNLLGKFIQANMGGGYGNEFHAVKLTFDKYFVYPNDWAGGLNFNRRKEERNIEVEEIFIPEDKQKMNLWLGQSINISKQWGDNIYYTLKVEDIKFYERPYHTATYNPYFHNTTDLIGAVGFYKEKFYKGNFIYGFGSVENIPYGYKAEIVGGYRFGEYEDTPYIGTNLRVGNKINIGYLAANISFGTFIRKNSDFKQTRINSDILYFTRLQKLKGGLFIRQFLNINYSSGILFLDGYDELMHFSNYNKLSSVSQRTSGTTRMKINPETVLFTPLHVAGFNFAFFGFTDIGTIGYNVNPFKNPLFIAAGIGARIRNESLVFSTIQIRIIVALKGHAKFRNNLFYINSETPLRANRYIPLEPRFLHLED